MFRDRLASSRVGQSIKEACKAIQWRLRNKKGRRKGRKTIPGLDVNEWATARLLVLGKSTESKRVLEAWTHRWQASAKPDTWDRVLRPPDHKVLKLHASLQKAESSALV